MKIIPSVLTRLKNLTLNFQRNWSLRPLFHILAPSGNIRSLNLAYSNLLDIPKDTFVAVFRKLSNVDISYCDVSAAQVIHLFSTSLVETKYIDMHGIVDEHDNSTLDEIPQNILSKFLKMVEEQGIKLLY